MQVYDVKMFDADSGNVIATYLGGAQSTADATRKCIERAKTAGRVSLREAVALTNKVLGYTIQDSNVDTNRWVFTVLIQEAYTL